MRTQAIEKEISSLEKKIHELGSAPDTNLEPISLPADIHSDKAVETAQKLAQQALENQQKATSEAMAHEATRKILESRLEDLRLELEEEYRLAAEKRTDERREALRAAGKRLDELAVQTEQVLREIKRIGQETQAQNDYYNSGCGTGYFFSPAGFSYTPHLSDFASAVVVPRLRELESTRSFMLGLNSVTLD